jgi:hypothetical protein
VKELIQIQSKLKAPKSQYNSFGGYKYRSLEDILQAVKPILSELGCILLIKDEIMQVGDRIYVKAIATLINSAGERIEVTAMAREALTKKGMDEAQITGAASSYARKYALNGLFLLDDTKDPDTDEHTKQVKQTRQQDKNITPAQLKLLQAEIAKRGVDVNKLLKFLKINDLKEIKMSSFNTILKQIQKKPTIKKE